MSCNVVVVEPTENHYVGAYLACRIMLSEKSVPPLSRSRADDISSDYPMVLDEHDKCMEIVNFMVQGSTHTLGDHH